MNKSILSHEQIKSLLLSNGFDDNPVIRRIKRNNHVWKIKYPDAVYYLKIYTKDWYGDDIRSTGFCVRQEVAAWEALANSSLGAPSIMREDTTPDNMIGLPFLLTSELRGESLRKPVKKVKSAYRLDRLKGLMAVVGSYLARMHAIQSESPGFVSGEGTDTFAARDRWQHPSWTYPAFKADAQRTWQADSVHVPEKTMDKVADFYRTYAPLVECAYATPSFVHADCHVDQFFVYPSGQRWNVSGVLDMEVASSGNSDYDLVKFMLEMAAISPAKLEWWQYFFEGYGKEPDFQSHKLRMLAARHSDYSWCWPGTRAEILRHILYASNWRELFDLKQIPVR